MAARTAAAMATLQGCRGGSVQLVMRGLRVSFHTGTRGGERRGCVEVNRGRVLRWRSTITPIPVTIADIHEAQQVIAVWFWTCKIACYHFNNTGQTEQQLFFGTALHTRQFTVDICLCLFFSRYLQGD